MSEQIKNVAVFFGGKSNEHEISIITGVFFLNILQGAYRLIPIYISLEGEFYTSAAMTDIHAFSSLSTDKFEKIILQKDGVWKWQRKPKHLFSIDCAVNCCHGGWGEGGGLAGMLNLLEIPSISPDLSVCGIFMDKYLSHLTAKSLSLPVVPQLHILEKEFSFEKEKILNKIIKQFTLPVIVKPTHLGSSIGIEVVESKEKLEQALSSAFVYDDSVVVEKYIERKRDINCAAYTLNGQIFISECEEPISNQEILTFQEKYLAGGKERKSIFPAELPLEISDLIKKYTYKLYSHLSFYGIIRVDYLYDGEKIYFNELNTIPGSLAYYLFSERITGAKRMFYQLIEEAIAKKREKNKKVLTTGILKKEELFFVKK